MLFYIFTLILHILFFLSLIWSVFFFFRPEDGRKTLAFFLFCLLNLISFTGQFFLLWKYSFHLSLSILTSLDFLLALGLFWWAVWTNWEKKLSIGNSQDIPQHLVQQGPYRWMRNPFYTSYLLYWLGAFLGTARVEWLCVWIIFYFSLFYAARFEEMKFSKSELAHHYQAYQQRVPRFLPFVGHLWIWMKRKML